MPRKADLPPIALGALGLSIALIFFITFGYPGLIHVYAGFIFELLVFLYAAYWALDIRRGLATHLFRRQALGLALVALGFGSGSFTSGTLIEATRGGGFAGDIGFLLGVFFNPLVIFYWIDSTVLASRRADPLGREVLHWTQVRKVCWTLMVGAPLLLLSIVAYARLIGVKVAEVSATILVMLSILTPFIVVAGVGVVFLLVIIRRARDRAFRSHVFWFLLFVAAAALSFLTTLATYAVLPPYAFGCPFWFIHQNGMCIPAANLPFTVVATYLIGESLVYASLVAAGFFLYRSSRSLVPMNLRLPEETHVAPPRPTPNP